MLQDKIDYYKQKADYVKKDKHRIMLLLIDLFFLGWLKEQKLVSPIDLALLNGKFLEKIIVY